MTTNELQASLNNRGIDKDNLISELATAISKLSNGKITIEQLFKVVTNSNMTVDDAVSKYLTGDMPPVLYVPTRGGFHLTQEHRKKISDSCKGRKMTEEEKERHRENARRKEVYMYDKNGNLIFQYNSTRDAERRVGFNNSNISRAARTGRMAYGYFWSYRPIGEKNENVIVTTETTIKKEVT